MIKHLINMVTILAVVMGTSVLTTSYLASQNVPESILMIIGFCIGLFGTKILIRWLYPEGILSPETEQSDKSSREDEE